MIDYLAIQPVEERWAVDRENIAREFGMPTSDLLADLYREEQGLRERLRDVRYAILQQEEIFKARP